MSILVLGGAGYIGSHTVDQLVNQGFDVAVVDSLITGHRAAVNTQARFYEGDIRDKDFMRTVFDQEDVEGVDIRWDPGEYLELEQVTLRTRLLRFERSAYREYPLGKMYADLFDQFHRGTVTHSDP